MKTNKYIPTNKRGPQKPRKPSVPQREGLVRKVVPKSISRVRKDLDSWRRALREADSVDRPRRRQLMDLYADVMLDALLTSQIEQRIGRTLSSEFSLKNASDKVDEASTRLLSEAVWFPLLLRYMLESVFYGHSLVEFDVTETDGICVTLIPRQNVVPEQGLFLFDSSADKGEYYRELREFGTYIVEFGAPGNYGLLNKAVPHALFKKFAHSCWSELCEIYGIPPRYIKTNTQDPAMLDRAEDMLRDMGAAAYFIIDTTEEFEFAKGADTNGDVYNNLIALCNSEMSMLISGAQIGQDTKNGNRSKEEVAIGQLKKYVGSDKRQVEDWMNSLVLPALYRLGFLPEGLRFSFNSEEDTGQLWERTAQAMQYYEIDPAWIRDKFGIEVTGKRSTGQDGFFG
ncbi:DUF935 family protein [uncultured Parabacteroides sp.]|uniref:phage portal protein family protein n=1 Tax=uncultured Parabacteroides sp. TaxID=512312 RepID=UPI002615D1A1|nr:DUF935 family protein [uncultured Parabacteroides sp.]